MRFYSQAGQDEYLFKNYFAGTWGRAFVDIGAHDGQSYSNTLFYEETLGWSGLCIEPSPIEFRKLKQRRTSKCVQCAVSNFTGNGRFVEFEKLHMMSGLIDCFNESHAALAQDVAVESRELLVPVRRLDSLLDTAGLRKIDYCSIDVEGAELAVLDSYDHNRYRIGIFSIENNDRNPKIRELMAERGYHLEAVFHGYDELYVHRDLARTGTENALSTISILIPSTFEPMPGSDTSLFLDRAIESVERQAFSYPVKYEILIGTPSDAVAPVRFEQATNSIRLARTPSGTTWTLASGLNAALKIARGNVLAVLYDRDVWHPDRVQVGLQSLERHDLVTSSQHCLSGVSRSQRVVDDATLSGCMFHRHVLRKIGDFDEADNTGTQVKWLGQFRQGHFTRCHQVESGFPLKTEYIDANRPELAGAIQKFPPGSVVVQHTGHEPLVRCS